MHLLEQNTPEAVALLGLYSRVSARLDDLAGHHRAALDRESTTEFLHLSDIAGALEAVGGFLNGETKAAREKLAAVRSCVAALTQEGAR